VREEGCSWLRVSASEGLGYIRRGDRLVVRDPFGRQRRVAVSSAGDLLASCVTRLG
jgi:hypothetical protein